MSHTKSRDILAAEAAARAEAEAAYAAERAEAEAAAALEWTAIETHEVADLEAEAEAERDAAKAWDASVKAKYQDVEFVLVDRNADGIPDAIRVNPINWEAEKARKAEIAKYALYHQHIADAVAKAASESTGKSASERAAARTVAIARAKASFTGDVPPETLAEAIVNADEKEKAEVKAAIQAELNKG